MNIEPKLVAFLVYFNRDRDYFECHEVLEELWLERGRDPLYSGLLQIAVALYHFRNGSVTHAYNKIEGARKMMRSAVRKLSDYPPDALGIRLDRLTEHAREYMSRLDRYEQEPFDFYPLEIEITDPKLKQRVDRAFDEIEPNVPQRTGYARGPKAKPEEAGEMLGEQES
ncbi:DUF309 domain-containing protein [Saccharibacillus kuerlensis]|uniref:DUF309 domain-containing protein n=1 Tax=Saccharibacillus kuerlensis TaxID=459527 RepID=A0ABQ2KRL2_9BACL|nr:DUF309 domain-containing protein [Saccharibacillus kuerlensis]GGN91253.1 hypothetical protein GCM10010969_02710 [Saccharibacillus kuerlensis]